MIEGKRAILRTIRQEDLDEFFNLTSKFSDIGEFWPIWLPSEQRLRKNFNETGYWERNNGTLLITSKKGRLLGTIFFFKGSRYMEGYEVGYRLFKPEDRLKGYMTGVLQIFSAYLFELNPIPRLQLTLIRGNSVSRRVAEKCGFKYEGTMRKAVAQRGVFHDLEIFSLLREECPSLLEVL